MKMTLSPWLILPEAAESTSRLSVFRSRCTIPAACRNLAADG
jgi:hypothetical protein